MNIAYTCKICKKPGIASADECPAEWVNKLAPMLTCDPCADNRREYIDSIVLIGDLCARTERMKMLQIDATEAKMMTDAIDRGLVTATRRYCTAIAKTFNLAREVWDRDFVDQLISYPGKVNTILKAYRRGLREVIEHPTPRAANMPYAD